MKILEVIICGWHHAVINDYCVYHKTSTWTIYFSLAQGTSIQLSEIIYRADPLGWWKPQLLRRLYILGYLTLEDQPAKALSLYYWKIKAFPDCGFLWIQWKCTFLEVFCVLLPLSPICLSFVRLNGENMLIQMAVTAAAMLPWPKESCCRCWSPSEKE